MKPDFLSGIIALICMFSMLVSAENEKTYFYRKRAYYIFNSMAAVCAAVAVMAFTGVLQ